MSSGVLSSGDVVLPGGLVGGHGAVDDVNEVALEDPAGSAGVAFSAKARSPAACRVFRPFAMEHPESAWALLEMMVKRVREAEAR